MTGGPQNPGTSRHGQYTKVLGALGIELPSGAIVTSGSVDPSATAVSAPAGSVYFSSLTNNIYVKEDAGSSVNWHMMNHDAHIKDPTGFMNNDTLDVSYDTSTGYVTLSHVSGFVEFLLKGHYYSYASPWTVKTTLTGSTPIAPSTFGANGAWFLRVKESDSSVVFDTNPWSFTDLMICFVFRNATAHFGLRECHNFMAHETHAEFHNTNGTYIRTAATVSGLTLPSTTTAHMMPAVSSVTLYDEDIPTTVAATSQVVYSTDTWSSGTYVTVYHSGPSGAVTFDTAARLPFITAGAYPTTNIIQYAPLSSGTATLTDVPEDNYVNIFTFALPVTSDAASQVFRRIFFTGQRVFTTLAAAQLETPSQVDFGALRSIVTEGYVSAMITYRKNASGGSATGVNVWGRAQLEAGATPVVFTGARASTVAITGVSPTDHQTLSNRTATAAHPGTSIDLTGTSWTAGGVLSSETTVTAALDKLSSTFAGASAVGLVSTGTQTFAGAKTFSSVATFNAGVSITGGTTNNYLAIQSGGTAGTTKLTLSSTTWQIGGTNSTITEAGAATFATSVNTPLVTVTGALTASSTTTLTITAGSTFALNVNTSTSALTIATTGLFTFPANGTHTIGTQVASASDTILAIKGGTTTTGSASLDLYSADNTAYYSTVGFYSNASRRFAIGVGKTASSGGVGVTGFVTDGFNLFNNSNVDVLSFTQAGIAVIGQVTSNTGAHTIQTKVATPDADYVLKVLKQTGADSSSNYFILFTTDNATAGYIWNNSGGTLELVSVSDANTKENIIDIPYSSLEKLNRCRFRQFDRKSGPKNVIGVIAQEWAAEFPSSVASDPSSGILGVGWGAEYYATVGHAIQELSAKITSLEQRITA